jgi:tungstate transport system ATP-binding protein
VAETLLGLRDIVVRYDTREALRIRSLDILANQVLAIIGPNGAGKSTLLRVMGLLQRPSAGTVLYCGENAYRGDPLTIRRRIATIFQEPLLLNATVYENAALGLKLRRANKEEIDRRLKPWLERLGIARLSGRSARTLSGGEAQRTSLARALALEPELLLLDEPFSGLDPASRESLQHDFQRIAREMRITTVLVTHDRDEAFALAGIIGVLKEGQLLQLGSRERVFFRPETNAVAEIVGIENRLTGVVEGSDDDGLVIGTHGRRIHARGSFKTKSTVVVCIRSEEISLDRATCEGRAVNRFRGKIIEITRGRTQQRVKLDCGSLRLVALLDGNRGGAQAFAEGDKATAAFFPAAVHLIEAGTDDQGTGD